MALKNWTQKQLALKQLGDGGTTDMWTVSASGTSEYYYNQIDLKHKPLIVYEGATVLTEGTLGSLTAGQWAWGDNDAIGGNRLYVVTSGSVDPDTLTGTARVNCSDAYTLITAGAGLTAVTILQEFSIGGASNLKIIKTNSSDVEQYDETYAFTAADVLKLDGKVVIAAGEKLKVMAEIEDVDVFISGDES